MLSQVCFFNVFALSKFGATQKIPYICRYNLAAKLYVFLNICITSRAEHVPKGGYEYGSRKNTSCYYAIDEQDAWKRAKND